MKLLKGLQYLGLTCIVAGLIWMQLAPSTGDEVSDAHQSAAWLLIFGGIAGFLLSRFMLWIVKD